MKKRIIQVLAAVVVTTIAIISLFIIDKCVIGAKEAEEKVNAYEEYHNMHPEKIDMKYDWYSGGGYIGADYRYNPNSDMILDEEYNELWKQYFDEKIEEIEASMNTNVLIEDYSIISYFDGSDVAVRYDDIFIYGIYNTQPVAEEERVAKGAEIISDIISQLGYNYNICGLHIDYYDLSGVYHFSIDMNKEKITEEMLLNCATEVSFEENPAIQEKWEAFYSQRTTFWSFEVEDYEISLVGMEDYGDYQLIMRDGEKEKVLQTESRAATENPEYVYGTFDNILGYSGFYIFEMHHFSYGSFYVMDGEELVCIAETWGNDPDDCFSVDVDKNGIPELICNVVYGDGAMSTIIYENYMSHIICGACDDLLDVEYDNIHYSCEYSYYLPEEEVVEIHYWLNSIQDYESKKYEIDLSKILFSEFAKVEGQKIKKEYPLMDNMILKVNDTLYYGTEVTGPMGDSGCIEGHITSSVDRDEVPTENGQSNFENIDSPYTYDENGGIMVYIDGEYHWFYTEEALKQE